LAAIIQAGATFGPRRIRPAAGSLIATRSNLIAITVMNLHPSPIQVRLESLPPEPDMPLRVEVRCPNCPMTPDDAETRSRFHPSNLKVVGWNGIQKPPTWYKSVSDLTSAEFLRPRLEWQAKLLPAPQLP